MRSPIENFLSAEELGISDLDRQGLITTLYHLEHDLIKETNFNMSHIWDETLECGSVGCLLGWSAHLTAGACAACNVGAGHWCTNHLPVELCKVFWRQPTRGLCN